MKKERIATFYKQSFDFLRDFEVLLHLPDDPRERKSKGIRLYHKTALRNVLIDINHDNDKGVFSFGVSHSCYLQFPEVENFYLPIKNWLGEKGVSGFTGWPNRTVTISSTADKLLPMTFIEKDIDLVMALPFFKRHLTELNERQLKLMSIVDVYNRAEACLTYPEVKKSIAYHTAFKRMILKALLKAPDFHGFSDWWIRYNKMYVERTDSESSKHILDGLKRLYATLTPVYDDPTRIVPSGVIYNKGPKYYEDEMKKFEEYQR